MLGRIVEPTHFFSQATLAFFSRGKKSGVVNPLKEKGYRLPLAAVGIVETQADLRLHLILQYRSPPFTRDAIQLAVSSRAPKRNGAARLPST